VSGDPSLPRNQPEGEEFIPNDLHCVSGIRGLARWIDRLCFPNLLGNPQESHGEPL
jgi:hypothetical protein